MKDICNCVMKDLCDSSYCNQHVILECGKDVAPLNSLICGSLHHSHSLLPTPPLKRNYPGLVSGFVFCKLKLKEN